MHGVVLGLLPTAKLVDLTHGIPAQDVFAAALQLRHAWPFFPRGSVHVAVVDPGVGSERPVHVGVEAGQAFVAPGNGLLDGALNPAHSQVYEVDPDRFGLRPRSRTFHGRDVFAPLAAALAGGADVREFGHRVRDFSLDPAPESGSCPMNAGGTVQVRVVHVDHFGNAITSLEPGIEGMQIQDYEVQVAGQSMPIVDTYASVAPGSPLALVDSWGHLEIAIRDGDAAKSLALTPGSSITLVKRLRDH